MSTTHYPGTPIPTRSAMWRRAIADMSQAWAAWRAGVAKRRRLRALDGLSEHTLRDIGMAECVGLSPRSVAESNFRRGL